MHQTCWESHTRDVKRMIKRNSLNEKSYNHVAFEINDCDFEQYENRVQCLGVEIKKPRNRISEEGRSIYFYDYDNHLFELDTGSLKERLHGYSCAKVLFESSKNH